MIRFLFKRLLEIIPILLLVSILIFLFVHMIPGDPARLVAGEDATLEDVELVRKELGLDKPLIEQYITYMGGLFQGDLGTFTKNKTPCHRRNWGTLYANLLVNRMEYGLGSRGRFNNWCCFRNQKK